MIREKFIKIIKKIVVSILVIALLMLIACIFKDLIVIENTASNERFIKTGQSQMINGYNVYVLYDSKTKVQYVFCGKGGFSVLVNKEGKPLLYKEEE